MDSISNQNKIDEINDEDSIELPADTMEILNEFLYNKRMRESIENSTEFEEDWVKYIFSS